MNRILSWKIDSCTYAYIFPINNSYISNRIPEDSLLWDKIITTISNEWKEKDYWDNFKKMQTEVKSKCNVFIPKNDKYWDFPDDNTNLPVNIVLLAGKDGEGYANGGNGTDSGEGDEVYKKFVDAINKELNKAKADLVKQNNEVKDSIEQKVGETIAEAQNTITETKEELTNTREELESKLKEAADALNKAAFDMSESGITGEKIQEALSSVNECGSWITANSGTVRDFKTDYDAAKRILGGVGTAEDASAGLFSQIGTTINAMDNTVGNVERWMVASAATIGDIATWYDVSASTVTEASRIINASASTITDAINFISGDGLTTKVTSIMDGRNATIKDEIMTETSAAVTNVRNVLNGLSGVVETSVTRLDGIDGDLASLGSRMSAEEEKMEQWMTVSDSAMTVAQDLRETWSVESGKLSTVASLTAQVDGEGNVMYFVSGSTDSESDDIRVWKDNNGIWRDSNGAAYDEEDVIVHWSQEIGSYIQQQASSITMSVMNSSGLTAAIEAAIERGENGEEESVIKLISDKLVITGDMIANAISAETANIGGILIGDGRIECMKTNNDRPLFLLNGDDGSLYAQNAEIEGTIRATGGYFKGELMANTGKIGGFTIENNQLVGSGDTAILKGGASYDVDEDLFKIGLNRSEKIVLYAYKSSGSTMDSSSISPVSSETKYKRIYIMQPTIEEGDEPVGYYTNNDYYGTPQFGAILNKFFKFSAETLTAIDVNPYKNWWNTALKNKKKNALRLEARVPVTGGWGNQVAGSFSTRYEFYTRDASGDYDVTAEACYLSGLPIYNTAISSNGIISCDSINASNGFYGGTINSDGKFTGELECNKGSLNNMSLENTNFNGPLFFNCGATLYATDTKGKRYLTISPYGVDDKTEKEYPNASYYRYIKNSNGNNDGKYYYEKINMVDIMITSGSVITIPSLNLTVWRYVPTARKGKTGMANISYTLGNNTENLIALNVLSQGKGSATFSGSSTTKVITATTDCRLTIYITYNLHLPTYYWLGADKAALSITLESADENKSEITVAPEKVVSEGMLIGSDGFMIRAGNYGLKVTEKGGIQKYDKSSNGWTAL